MTAADLTLPTQLGRYRLVKKLGAGGMGTVFLAEDSTLGRRVAVKVPHVSSDDSPVILDRFLREARAAASVDHPFLCPVHDVGEANGYPFLVMPFIEGTPLSRRIDPDNPWPALQAVTLVRQLAIGLQVMHERGIVHRDLKPANVMLRASGEPVIMDFGLAKSLTGQSRQLTNTGAPLGTPAFMAPEQVLGQLSLIGPATDVYALGVILYELLTGRVPFEGPLAIVYGQVLHAPPQPPSVHRPDLDPALDALCLKAMAKKPEERYPSMKEFIHALEPIAPSLPPTLQTTVPGTAPSVAKPVAKETESFQLAPTAVPPPPEIPVAAVVPPPPVANILMPPEAAVVESLIVAEEEEFAEVEVEDTVAPAAPPTPLPPGPARPTVPRPLSSPTLPRVQPEGERQECPGCGKVVTVPAQSRRRLRCPHCRTLLRAASPRPEAERPGRWRLRLSLFVLGGVAIVGWMLLFPAPSLQPEAVADMKLERGQRKTIPVKVKRTRCKGPVELRLEGLPAGLRAANGVIPAGGDQGTVELWAERDAAAEMKTARLVASAEVQGETTIRLTVGDALKSEWTNSIGMKLMLVPAGRFTMGSPATEEGRGKDEEPHEVEITQPFYMGACEVTQKEYAQVMRVDQPSHFKSAANAGQLPVEQINWFDAVKFCEKLSALEKERKEHQGYRLPTEAQWEYACRGGNGSQPFGLGPGDRLGFEHANFDWQHPWNSAPRKEGSRSPSRAGSYPANVFGLFDMHGNVWEWCSDWYERSLAEAEEVSKDPKGPDKGRERVLRGGSWGYDGKSCRAARRYPSNPTTKRNDIGFRVVCDPLP
jgi:serine/threonine protein kinase/formylglycine-generating enzyme required for sulfatase activity